MDKYQVWTCSLLSLEVCTFWHCSHLLFSSLTAPCPHTETSPSFLVLLLFPSVHGYVAVKCFENTGKITYSQLSTVNHQL